MLEFLFPLTPWHWLITCVALISIEMIFFGAYFFLSCGIAAGITAIVLFLAPNLSAEMQGTLFAALSVGIIILWKYFFESASKEQDTNLNERAQSLIGNSGVMESSNRVRIGDSTWPAQSDTPLKEGDAVRITAVKGIHLIVEKV